MTRRTALAGACGALLLGATACGSTGSSSTSSTSSAAASGAPSGAPAGAPSGAMSGPPSGAMSGPPAGGGQASTTQSAATKKLSAEVKDKFKQATYQDATTGESLPYNIYLPDDYDPSKTYPVVLYIADSSLVGQDVTAPLSQYGALIWASKAEQAKHESIVVVPEYPSVIIDDHGSFTTTEYVEMTARLMASIEDKYSVDKDRVYGTGQSMGCMTVMDLAAKHPDLFTAELFVSGQWQASQLANLADEKFVYVAAGGDSNSSGGQKDVEGILDKAGVSYGTATWDATWSSAKLDTAANKLLADGDSTNFATFKTGTVLKASGSSSSATSSMGGGTAEHMASFEPAYKITALRDWLFQQTAK